MPEALIAIHTRRHTYDPSQPFTPWAYAIARYKFIDYLRRTRASAQDLPIEDTQELSAREDQVEFESCLDLQKLMEALPRNMKADSGC